MTIGLRRAVFWGEHTMTALGSKVKLLNRLATAALIAALLLLAGCVVNPVTGEEEFSLMSPAQEIALGKRYYPQTIQMNQGLAPKDPALQAYVNKVGRNLAEDSHRPKIPWEFCVVNTSQVNAFALPGGKVSITRGLITKMKSEDELAAVLGHEIGHVTARHSAAQYTRGVFISLGAAVAGAVTEAYGLGSLGSSVAGAAGNLLMLSYSRDQERQADQLGFQYMVLNRYNPNGMVKVFNLFKSMRKREPTEIEAFLSSHPLDSERIAAAQKRVRQTPRALQVKPFSTQAFNRAMATQKWRAPAYRAMDKGDALLGKKRYADAVAQYRAAIKRFNGDGVIHARLAMAYMAQQRLTDAQKTAVKAVRISPRVFFPNLVAGYSMIKGKNYAKALGYFSRAESLLPNHVENRFLLAYCRERTGSRYQAAQVYRSVVKLDPRGKYGQAAKKRLAGMGYKLY